MESLLTLSFDNLSSYDGSKVRKGLRQLEGLLAQICLSQSSSSRPGHERRQSIVAASTTRDATPPKELAALPSDPAFREFFKLQEGFEFNCAIRLIGCLERLMGRGADGSNDLLIVATLDLLHGVLLIHPPSCTLFAREIYMNLLLDLLDPEACCPAVLSAALITLVTALLQHPSNTRTFERLDGLLTVTALFKARGTSREVKMKSVEFLYFYLMPETPVRMGGVPIGGNVSGNMYSGSITSSSGGSICSATSSYNSTCSTSFSAYGSVVRGKGRADTRSSEEKQAMLGRHLSNVEDLVEDLRESATFGGSVF